MDGGGGRIQADIKRETGTGGETEKRQKHTEKGRERSRDGETKRQNQKERGQKEGEERIFINFKRKTRDSQQKRGGKKGKGGT